MKIFTGIPSCSNSWRVRLGYSVEILLFGGMSSALSIPERSETASTTLTMPPDVTLAVGQLGDRLHLDPGLPYPVQSGQADIEEAFLDVPRESPGA